MKGLPPFTHSIASDSFALEYETCNQYIKPASTTERFDVLPNGSQTAEKVIIFSAGQRIITEPIHISSEHVLELAFSLPTGMDAGSGAAIELRLSNGGSCISTWYSHRISELKPLRRQTIRLGLSQFAGETRWFELALVSSSGINATVGISRFVICEQGLLSRVNALSNYGQRLKNEISHFSGTAYTHTMYGSQKSRSEEIELERHRAQLHTQPRFLLEQEASLRKAVSLVQPEAGEPVFGFAQRCLGSVIPLTPPNFYSRASNLSRDRTLRILSLCAGAARIEEEITKHCQTQVELTLLDASEDLIQRAAARFSEGGHKVRCLVGDVNNGLPGDESFNIIVCVSALHHVANLELVLSQINERLTPDGEFWSIGEQIGRNGNRLWPEAMSAANDAFKKLPARYRKNAHTNKIDETVPDDDFSTGCFEGIRSEELSTMLESYLVPVDVYKRNCFLWRLSDATYCDNFNLSFPEDLQHLRELVIAEAMHWVRGGRGTEMHGVFRRKQF